MRGDTLPVVIGGESDADAIKQQLADFGLIAEVRPDWLPQVRINFTLGSAMQAAGEG